MRVAYLHRAFPGLFGPLVAFVATRGQHGSVFVAEKWARNTHIPGVRKARIPGPAPNISGGSSRAEEASRTKPESRMALLMSQAAKAGDVLLHLRKGGFVPDVLYGTADEGYLLYARDIFPKARLVLHLSWFYAPSMLSLFNESGSDQRWLNKPASWQAVIGRVHNSFVLSALTDCDLAIASSLWQAAQFSSSLAASKIDIVKSGVDTNLFQPAQSPVWAEQEIVTFSCQGDNPARGIEDICESLPILLERRPRCHARLLSFAPTRSESAKQQHTDMLMALLPPQLSAEQRQRIEIVVSPEQHAYVTMLQSSVAYVYLTSPTMLSAGILEAMSCGVPVLASDTGPVRELVRHGENGFLHKASVSLAEQVEEVLEQAPASPIRRHARETVLAEHDLRNLLPRYANIILGLDKVSAF